MGTNLSDQGPVASEVAQPSEGAASSSSRLRRSRLLKITGAGCLTSALVCVLMVVVLAALGPYVRFPVVGDDGRVHDCQQMETLYWDEFDPDGTWKDGGQIVYCDGKEVRRTHSASECADLGLPEGCDLSQWSP